MKRTVHACLANAPKTTSDAVDDGLACRHRIGNDTAVVCKERYGVIIVGAESIGHLGRVSSGALL